MAGGAELRAEATAVQLLGPASPEDKRLALTRYLESSGVGDAGLQAVIERAPNALALLETKARRHSRLGGTPLLPAGGRWPETPDGRPLTFIAALDLAELPAAEPLPQEGTLLFFWDFEFFEHDLEFEECPLFSRVLYALPGHPLLEVPDPPPSPLAAADGIDWTTEPTWFRAVAMPIAGEPTHAVEAAGPDRDALVSAMNGLMEALGLRHHQLLGLAREVQHPVLDELALHISRARPDAYSHFAPEERERGAWRLLAGFDSAGQMMFGDAGCLYFLVPRADLEEVRFDRCLAVMQCA